MENVICEITDKDIGEDFISSGNSRLRIAARGIVIRDDGKIAVFNKSNKNEYKLPGGGMDKDEIPEETFKREVLEETGCIVEIITKLGITKEYKQRDNFEQISNVFVGKVVEDTKKMHMTKKEIDEGGKLLWEYPNDALTLIKNSYNKLVGSEYEDVYTTKFIVLRDRNILEYYIKNKNICG